MSSDLTRLRHVSQMQKSVADMAKLVEKLLNIKETFETFPEILFSADEFKITADKTIEIDLNQYPDVREIYDIKDKKTDKITISLFMLQKSLLKSITGCSKETMEKVQADLRALRFALQYMAAHTKWIKRCLYHLGNTYLRALAEDRAEIDRLYKLVMQQSIHWQQAVNRLIEYYSSSLSIKELANFEGDNIDFPEEE